MSKWLIKKDLLFEAVDEYLRFDVTPEWEIVADKVGETKKACQTAFDRYKSEYEKFYIKPSRYPLWDDPLEMEGDALVIPDPEFPFHNAEFLNNILRLAKTWKINQCILGGDALHMHSISSWAPSWVNVEKEYNAPNFSRELKEARKSLKVLERQFKQIDFVLGNHEGRLLRALETVLDPDELARLLEIKNPKWRIAPFYYSILRSKGETYRITHPKGTAQYATTKLASKFHQHILMCHSHALTIRRDISNTYWACEIGCCVDEQRLAYVGQRDNYARSHSLGAAIVRNGYLWILTPWSDWKSLSKM